MTFVGMDLQFRKDLEELTGKRIFIEDIHWNHDRVANRMAEFASRENAITFLNGATLKSFNHMTIKIEKPIKVFGKKITLVDGQTDNLNWSDAILKNPLLDETKMIIGDIDGNVIAFTIDLFHAYPNQHEIVVYALVKAGFLKKSEALTYLKQKDDFIFKFKQNINEFKNSELKMLESEIKYKRHEIENYESSISTKRGDLCNLIRKMCAIGTIKETTYQELSDEISKVKKLPFVKSISIDKESLTFMLIDVWFKIMNKRRLKIGKYKINIEPNGNFCIFHKNLEGTTHPQHPHVSSRGVACLGNFEELTKNLLDGQLEVFLIAMWDFLNFPRDKHGFIKMENFLKKVELAKKGDLKSINFNWDDNEYSYADIDTLRVEKNGEFTIKLRPSERHVNKDMEIPMESSKGGYWKTTLA